MSRRVALAIVCILLAVPFPAQAARLQATGRMTVVASSMVFTELRISQPTQISLDYWSQKARPTPRFSPGPEFAAIVLASESSKTETYVAARMPQSKSVAQRLISLGPNLCMLDEFCDVPAGDYRLYVITDGPIKIELEFQGIPGSSTVKPNLRTSGELFPAATASYLHTTPQGPVELAAHGSGFAPTLDGESNFLFKAFWFRGPYKDPILQVGDVGECVFSGEPPPEAYAPGCPTGDMGANVSSFQALKKYKIQLWGTVANLGPGQRGNGYYAVHTGIYDPGFVGFWLDLGS